VVENRVLIHGASVIWSLAPGRDGVKEEREAQALVARSLVLGLRR